MTCFRTLACAVAASLSVCLSDNAASAGDYPFTGVYGIAVNGPDIWQFRRSACLTTFYTQTENGVYRWYHVDKDRLLEKNELSYLIFEIGKCTWNPENRVESCLPSYAVGEKLEPSFGYYHGNDFSDTGVSFGRSENDVLRQRKSRPPVWQLHCLFSLSDVSPFLSSSRTHYAQNAVDALRLEAPDNMAELLMKIREKLGVP